MMIVVASLRLSGFFALATAWVMQRAARPLLLLCAVTATSGMLSAFLVNDAICLVLAPLVLDLTLRMRRQPVPYLLAVAMASNVGSTATITGNPQNIMIGSFSRIPYATFALGAGAGGDGRAGRCRRIGGAAAPRGVRRRRRGDGGAAGEHPRQPRAGGAGAGGDGADGGAVLRRAAAGEGGDRHRRAAAADAAGEKRSGSTPRSTGRCC